MWSVSSVSPFELGAPWAAVAALGAPAAAAVRVAVQAARPAAPAAGPAVQPGTVAAGLALVAAQWA